MTVALIETGVSGSAPALAGALRPGHNVASSGPANRDCLGAALRWPG